MKEVRCRILYAATSDIHLKTFHIPYLKWLISSGYEVHVAVENRCNVDLGFCSGVHYLPFKRSPFHPSNLRAFAGLKKLINEIDFGVIHCHTPTVSVLARIAGIAARRNGAKIVFTAHGFHFFRGAGLFAWVVYFSIEKVLSFFTDATITINKEDYVIAKRYFSSSRVFRMPGMGVDHTNFFPLEEGERERIRAQLGFREEDFILIVVGELNSNKNQEFILRALSESSMCFTRLRIVMIGKGERLPRLKLLAERFNISVDFLGWRDDVDMYAKISDVGVSASRREGLGIALIEQMLCGLPVIGSSNRGHREVIDHGVNGYLFEEGNRAEFLAYFSLLYSDPLKRRIMGRAALEKANEFRLDRSMQVFAQIYNQIL